MLTSPRGVQQVGCLAKVQDQLGCSRTSLGSLSEAAHVCDAEPLHHIVSELAQGAVPLQAGKDADVLRGLTAVEGSLLPAKMAWALWVDQQHRAAKLHLHFGVFKDVPCSAAVTDGNGNEKKELRGGLQPDRLYVINRGYAEYRLFQDIVDAKFSYIGRLRDNAVYEIVAERPLSADARKAGVVRDLVVWLGGPQSGGVFKQKLRLIAVANGKTDAQGRPEILFLASNCLDLDAAWIALGYKYRWTVEFFFRWFKCILGCQPLLSTGQDDVTIQVYLTLFTSLLIALWTGRKPSKRTFEVLCHYFVGWANGAELLAHVRSLDEKKKKS